MFISATINEITREIKWDKSQVAAVDGDYAVNGFKLTCLGLDPDYDLTTGTWYAVFTAQDGTSHSNPLTVSGSVVTWEFDNNINKGGAGVIKFFFYAVTADKSGKVLKRWDSAITDLRVAGTIDYENQEEEAARESEIDRLAGLVTTLTATAATINDVKTVISRITNSSPVVVATVADLSGLDTTKYQLAIVRADGYLYYYDGSAWQKGIKYGSYELDTTLAESGKAADAAAVGSALGEIKEDLSAIQTATAEDVGKALKAKTVANGKVTEWEFGGADSGLNDDIKSALLQLAQKVTYADENGMTYYNDLRNALYPPAELVRIVAAYNQSKRVYTTDKLNVLIDDLTVSAVWSDGTSITLSSSDYTLSGTLTEGESTITVSYEDKTATFTVTVTYKKGQRYLTINDVVEGTGVTNMVISDGTVSYDSVETFSIYEIDPGVLPLITGISPVRNIISNKIDENNYIGYDTGGKRFRFTKTTDSTRYNGKAESGDGERIVTGNPVSPYVVDIINGTLTLTGANNSGKVEYTYANCFAIWCSNNINNMVKLTNCEVNYDGSI